jgi:Asp-tRNA(Asn)/Glu-tRNA(Gln) amidotransferase A subunit family amidase
MPSRRPRSSAARPTEPKPPAATTPPPPSPGRRQALRTLAAASVGSAVLADALAAGAADKDRIGRKMLERVEWLTGVELDDRKRDQLLATLHEALAGFAQLRAVPLDNAVPPALVFRAATGSEAAAIASWELAPALAAAGIAAARTAAEPEVAFAGLAELGALLRAGRLTSVALTRFYLERLRRHDARLRCVVNYTEALALEQAAAADRELAAGLDRGPLHGIPWGAKDLIAVPGYPTTWGSGAHRDQVRPETAAVFERLTAAGAVLVAKLSVGELAWGDEWFGGTTETPWQPGVGSSGSSAGSAAATAAGLVGFALGTETWGSIVSPATRCGATGLRPTFGRVSRHGVMALAWSMDKVGVLGRSAADCALVFRAIEGSDRRDPSSESPPFHWPWPGDPTRLRVGYVASLFDRDRAQDLGKGSSADARQAMAEWQENDRRTLEEMRRLGFELKPVALPAEPPVGPLAIILSAEAASAFDDLTRSGRDALLVRQKTEAWPTELRLGQLVPAVEYLRANRLRTVLAEAMARLEAEVDVWLAPSVVGDHLLLTNLTGQPALCLPNGFRSDGLPTSITLTGRRHGEAELLAVGDAYQRATTYHRQRPPGF